MPASRFKLVGYTIRRLGASFPGRFCRRFGQNYQGARLDLTPPRPTPVLTSIAGSGRAFLFLFPTVREIGYSVANIPQS